MNKLILLLFVSFFTMTATFATDHQNSSSPNSLGNLPLELLGEIAQYLDPKDIYRIKKMTGDRNLEAKLSQPSANLLSGPVAEFDLSKKGATEALIDLLKSSKSDVKLKLRGVTLENLVSILPYCEPVVSLDLFKNNIGDAGAQALAGSEHLRNLTSLNLAWNKIGAAGAEHIATLTKLTSLDLGWNEIGDAGAEHIAKLINLTSLKLIDNQIGAAGAKHIATLTNLTSLYLPHNQIGAAGAEHIATLTNLTSLDLGMNRIGDAGAQALAGSNT